MDCAGDLQTRRYWDEAVFRLEECLWWDLVVGASTRRWHYPCAQEDFAMGVWLSSADWAFNGVLRIARKCEDWRRGTTGGRVDTTAVRLHCYCCGSCTVIDILNACRFARLDSEIGSAFFNSNLEFCIDYGGSLRSGWWLGLAERLRHCSAAADCRHPLSCHNLAADSLQHSYSPITPSHQISLSKQQHVRQRHLPRPHRRPLPAHRCLGQARHLQRRQSDQHCSLLCVDHSSTVTFKY